MTKISLLFLTAIACNNGKITAAESDPASPETNETTPGDAEQDPIDDQEDAAPQTDPEDETDLSDDDAPADTESDTGEATSDAEDEAEVTLEDYLKTYCETFAVPCMGYATIDDCVLSMMDAHFIGCSVEDKDALAECDAWVATIDCDETSWHPACDEFITCD